MRVACGLVALGVLALPVPAADPEPWEAVVSAEGGFAVDMPKPPDIKRTRNRRAAGGGLLRTRTLGCDTPAGLYLVYRIDLPGAVAPGTENAALDAVRDDLAGEWNGKVLADKRVKAGRRVGRDFTVRGKPVEESGVLTLRVRMYLDGRAVYAMMVGSPPDRDLPEDAGRFLGSLVIGNDPVKAAGGPEPEPKGKDVPDWGLVIDPDGDCTVTPAGPKALAIEVPGTWHDLNPHVNKLNAPRVVRAVDGDFSVTVKVTGEFKPTGRPQNPRSVPSSGGGIVVWSDSDNFIRLERFAVGRNGRVVPFAVFLEREAGYQGAEHNEGYPGGGDCYLRMERKGSRIAGAVSPDGQRWKVLKPIDTLWGPRLKVGLVATNSNSDPLTVRFEEFALTAKPAPPKRRD